MTRKRFVKLLMSEGYSRNEANAFAAFALIRWGEYNTAYKNKQLTNDIRIDWKKVDLDALNDAINKVAEAATKIVSALAKAFCAFSETFNKEMEAQNDRKV